MDHRHKITTKARALHRIRIIKGHLDSVEQMLEKDKYCVDIVHQSRAVQKALQKLDLLIINDHLNCCVIKQIKNGQESKSTAELLRLFEYR